MSGKLYGFFGPGWPYFTTEGTTLIENLRKIIESANERLGYKNISTPEIVPKSLLEMTGHEEFYGPDIYEVDSEHRIKPMNCPGFLEVLLGNGIITSNDLPIKLAEPKGRVSRTEWDHELKETLKRLHVFTQDDSHALLESEEAAEALIEQSLEMMVDIYRMFGFEFDPDNFRIVVTNGKPKKSLGTDEEWKKSEGTLRKCLDRMKGKGKIPFYEDDPYSAAFYGPKINVHIKNSEGKWVQCGTIQLDNQMPKSAGLTYIGEDGETHTPVMLHRAFLGSYERAISILMDHYERRFPSWLSPVKARILPRNSSEISGADDVAKRLYEAGIITEIDYTDDPIEEKKKKLDDPESHFIIPYSIQLGKNEDEIIVTNRDTKVEVTMTVDEFIKSFSEETQSRSNDLLIGR